MNVLVIEDEQKIADILVQGLQASGFQTHHEADGFRGLNTALIKSFDAIVMDVAMPLMDGFQVLAEIRRKGIHTPVIMLTARTELADRLQGFESGADDYLAKPFFMEELIVRIKTLIARKTGNVENVVRQSGLTLDRFKRLAEWEQRSVALTQREFVLLECLMLSPGQIFSRQQMLKHVWNVDFDPGTNVVDVCIQRLRKKLSGSDLNSMRPFPIETIRGVGYRLNNA
jgi:two-component system OmpR family response regulator